MIPGMVGIEMTPKLLAPSRWTETKIGSLLSLLVTFALISNCVCATQAMAAPESKPPAFDVTHRLFTTELKKYVHNGLVDYKSWKAKPENLDSYLDQLRSVSADEYKKLSLDDKKALWINAYNAMTIKVVLDHYPLKGSNKYYPENSLRQIEDVWDNFSITVGGRKATIDQMEHDVLRKDFRDPRIHFAVVCAAKDGGKLRNEAFTGRGIEGSLEECTKTFMQNPRNVQFDLSHNVVRASKIFNWFALDFARAAGIQKFGFPPPTDDEVVLKYLILKAPTSVKNRLNKQPAKKSTLKVVYQAYDWSLNEYVR